MNVARAKYSIVAGASYSCSCENVYKSPDETPRLVRKLIKRKKREEAMETARCVVMDYYAHI